MTGFTLIDSVRQISNHANTDQKSKYHCQINPQSGLSTIV
jgi:hypothetical protein